MFTHTQLKFTAVDLQILVIRSFYTLVPLNFLKDFYDILLYFFSKVMFYTIMESKGFFRPQPKFWRMPIVVIKHVRPSARLSICRPF